MHKITKGIKKKIKSKKGNKGDDLFDPAELEKYRKEKEQREAAAAASEEGAEGGEGGGRAEAGEEPREGAEAEGAKEEDEEWQRFKALTAGVDSVLKKTQGDLDRIKSTSYFQRKKPGGGDKKVTGAEGAAAEPKESASKGPAAGVKAKRWVGFEEGAAVDEKAPEEEEGAKEAESAKAEEEKPQKVEEKVPEEEEEELEEEEDIFDTSYVDVVASGELKLAYIPESPTTEGPGEDGFDPFDTSIAEKVIGPEPESQKGKKPRQLVSLGCAVDVLTGRIDKAQVVPNPAQSSKKRRVASRRPEDVDLFSLDDDAEPQEPKESNAPGSGAPSRRASGATVDPFGALDENGIPDTTPIGEALNIAPPPKEEEKEEAPKEEEELVLKDLVAEFDIIGETEPVPIEAEEELIFTTKQEPEATVAAEEEDEFATIAAESAKKRPAPPCDLKFEVEVEEEDDPFDTSAAAGVLGELPTTPQKAPPVRPPQPVSSPDVDVLLGGGKDDDFGWEEFDHDRGGVTAHPPLRPAPPSAGPPSRPSKPPTRPPPITNTAVSDGGFVPSLAQPPLTFTETAIEAITRDLDSKLEAVDSDDPFDTTFAEVVAAPGRAELRLIESEILGDVEDDTFDPRAEDNAPGRPEVFSSVKIQISLPAGEEGAEQEIGGDAADRGVSDDLFDSTGAPEGEFVSSLQLSHRDLLGGSTTDLSKLGHDPISPDEPIESKEEEEIGEYVDPFDTSIVDPKIAPGKAELKIIEKELLGEGEVAVTVEPVGLQRNLSDPDFDPRGEEEAPRPAENHTLPEADISRPDLLEAESRVQTESQAAESILSPSARPDLLSVGEEAEAEFSKPLTPLVEEGERISEAILKTDGVDPFDTTFAENILPGKAELRIIEKELFGGPDVTAGTGITRSLSDPDFDPRESSGGEKEDQKQAVSVNRRRFSDVTALSGGIEPRTTRVVHPTTLPLQSIANPAPRPQQTAPAPVRQNQPDLLAVEEEEESACKPLSPARETSEADEGDPFDTSTISVEVLKPGKAELKILESELIGGSEEDQPAPTYQTNITAQVQAFVVTQYQSAQPSVQNALEPVSIEVKPPDLLNLPENEQEPAGPKPLTPLVENSDFPEDDFDPFDTSIAEGIGPGRTELKLLESELIGQ